jgi:hypothetical protein
MSSIARQPHMLRKEKTLAIPRHFVFFDTETKQIPQDNGDTLQVFDLGWCVYYGREHGRHKEREQWFKFESVSLFWDFVFSRTQPKNKLWIIARNIVFDFTICEGWKHLKAEGYKLKFFHNNGVSVIVTVRKGNRTIVLLDSMNWFTESLAKTGERIGIPKMSIDFKTCTREYLSKYCRNDVRIELENFKLFIKFLLGNMISRLCYTKASTAMAAYLLRHYHTPIYVHNNKEALELERGSYKGGRCECFFIGDASQERHYVLDVNSLYPYCMSENKYPVKYKQTLHNISVSKLSELIKEYSIVAKVELNTTEPVYAFRDKRTIFPIGKFVNDLTTPELKYALSHNHIVKVIHCVIYEQANIFSSYVKTMYSLRKEFSSAGVKEYEVICKYLLNALYGKFGQKAEQWTKIGDAPNEPDREEILFTDSIPRVRRLRYLLGEVYELTGHSEAFNSFPAISSHVTAYGRLYLWHLMNVCGYGNYLYCDTDSLIVNDIGYNNLYRYLDDNELGKLKLEYITDSLIIYGLKDYVTDTKTVVKGIRKNATKIKECTYTQEQWPTFRGLLKTDDVNTYVVKKMEKHLSREYTKGIVQDNGNVTPIVFV